MEPEAAPPFDFEQLSREIALARLKDAADPAAAAARTLREILVPGVTSSRDRQDPRTSVIQAVRGVLTAFLVLTIDPIAPAVALVEEAGRIGEGASLDPERVMTWTLEAIASLMTLAGLEARNAIHAAVEEKYTSVGAIFYKFCEQAAAKEKEKG